MFSSSCGHIALTEDKLRFNARKMISVRKKSNILHYILGTKELYVPLVSLVHPILLFSPTESSRAAGRSKNLN